MAEQDAGREWIPGTLGNKFTIRQPVMDDEDIPPGASREHGAWLVAEFYSEEDRDQALADHRFAAVASPVLQAALGALIRCDELFTEIRGDWSDPRSQCREGWDITGTAITQIQDALYSLTENTGGE